MQHFRLNEYRTLEAVQLSAGQVAALGELRDAISIAPTPRRPGYYDLTAGSLVGVINLGSATIEIQPKIPIDRLLFLLSYRVDPRHWNDAPFDFAERESLLEAIIPGFTAQVRRAFRRGVLQGYRVDEESSSTVRGRIRFSEQIRTRYGLAPPVEVQYHEFSEDIVENQLIKAAIARLGRLHIRSPESRRLLREFDAQLERVRLHELDPRALPDVLYTRLNQHYRPAVELAKLILRSTSFDVGVGNVRASTFLVDLSRVFEDFVVIALREALRLSARAFPQGATGKRLRLDRAGSLALKPDISWWDQGRCVFVGDVKYKRLSPSGFQHGDLYQLLAYTIASGLPRGMLIYAKGEAEPTLHAIVHVDKVLEVVALDLAAKPDAILTQIDQIAHRIRTLKVTASKRFNTDASRQLLPSHA